MAKKKEVTVYDEMNMPKNEVEETLPYSYVKKEPQVQQVTETKDYLDDFTPTQKYERPMNQPLMFSDQDKENIIAELLRVDWERIEHIIRGHKPKVDKEGNEYFVQIDNHYLNEHGVNQVLHFLSLYLSKDIKLARYDKEQVETIMKNFSTQFTDFFFDNIEEFGLNTPEKKKMSKMFVHGVIDLVDSAYSHAIEGRTMELLTKQFTVMQQQGISEGGMPMPMNQPRPKASIFGRIFG